jgi:hypothetical protein
MSPMRRPKKRSHNAMDIPMSAGHAMNASRNLAFSQALRGFPLLGEWRPVPAWSPSSGPAEMVVAAGTFGPVGASSVTIVVVGKTSVSRGFGELSSSCGT